MALGATRRHLLAGGLASAATKANAAAKTLQPLKDAAAGAGLVYGTAVEPHRLDADADFARLVRQQCSMLVAENATKCNAIRPERDRFDFTQADRLTELAEGWGMAFYGHAIVWHEAMPDWLPGALRSSDPRALLESHVRTVVSRYAGRALGWDVVVEPVERNDRRADGLRRSPWFEAIGPDYLDIAFNAAHDADPVALLSLCDYGLEYDNVGWMVEKRGTMLALLRDLRRRKTPVHVLAMQSHLRDDAPPGFGAGLRTFIRQVADLGLTINISELDVRTQQVSGDDAAQDRMVSDTLKRYLDVMLDEPAVKIVNSWGLTDRYAAAADFYPRPDATPARPLPFDRDLRPKSAAEVMVAAFRRRRRR